MDRERAALLCQLPIWRAVAGSCLISLFLLTATPLPPVLATLLAMVDRSHHVAVQQMAHGIQVMLRHDCFNGATHHHGMVARALTLIAQHPAAGQPDHVIQFASATSDQAAALAIGPAPDSPATELSPPCDLLPRLTRLTAAPAAHPRPPPEASELLLSVRSTVLVI